MLIANPIYDIVFKYLMEDSKVVKLLIGSIIGAEDTYLEEGTKLAHYFISSD